MAGSATLRTIVADHGAALAPGLSHQQLRVLEHIGGCQTEALGWHRRSCGGCGYEGLAFNSCRNRHCPRCLGSQAAEWFTARTAELLPIPYFHVVFTLPRELQPLCRSSPAELYGLLFRAAAQTLLEIAADPRHLGADLGFFGVLHTWGRDLRYHPHVHYIVPGGGLARDETAPEGTRWVGVRKPGYFLPVQVLSPVFRGKFLAGLQDLNRAGKLELVGKLAHLANPASFENFVRMLRAKYWHLYAEPPFAGPEQVLGYLARYTHKTAISDDRIVAYEDGQVGFRWKDHADGGKQKVETLPGPDFLRRFVAHILPPGFQRIRYYGFLANRHRSERLELCRRLLDVTEAPDPASSLADLPEGAEPSNPPSGPPCPTCGRPLTCVLVYRPHPASIRLGRSTGTPRGPPN